MPGLVARHAVAQTPAIERRSWRCKDRRRGKLGLWAAHVGRQYSRLAGAFPVGVAGFSREGGFAGSLAGFGHRKFGFGVGHPARLNLSDDVVTCRDVCFANVRVGTETGEPNPHTSPRLNKGLTASAAALLDFAVRRPLNFLLRARCQRQASHNRKYSHGFLRVAPASAGCAGLARGC